MRTNIHPTYFEQAQVVCACGNRFTVGSTVEVIHVELCNKCHPFYTGSQRFVDTRSVIKRFQEKVDAAKQYQAKKAKKASEVKKAESAPKTLREMLLGAK